MLTRERLEKAFIGKGRSTRERRLRIMRILLALSEEPEGRMESRPTGQVSSLLANKLQLIPPPEPVKVGRDLKAMLTMRFINLDMGTRRTYSVELREGLDPRLESWMKEQTGWEVSGPVLPEEETEEEKALEPLPPEGFDLSGLADLVAPRVLERLLVLSYGELISLAEQVMSRFLEAIREAQSRARDTAEFEDDINRLTRELEGVSTELRRITADRDAASKLVREQSAVIQQQDRTIGQLMESVETLERAIRKEIEEEERRKELERQMREPPRRRES